MIQATAFSRLCRARDTLRDVDSSLSIDQVAREAEVSPFYFIRQFQALFGETPHQYRIRARLELAKDLLESSDCSVTAVCMMPPAAPDAALPAGMTVSTGVAAGLLDTPNTGTSGTGSASPSKRLTRYRSGRNISHSTRLTGTSIRGNVSSARPFFPNGVALWIYTKDTL